MLLYVRSWLVKVVDSKKSQEEKEEEEGNAHRDLRTRPSPTSTITGGHINQDPPYTQKPIYYTFFANHIWSLLLCSPVIAFFLSRPLFSTAQLWEAPSEAVRESPSTVRLRADPKLLTPRTGNRFPLVDLDIDLSARQGGCITRSCVMYSSINSSLWLCWRMGAVWCAWSSTYFLSWDLYHAHRDLYYTCLLYTSPSPRD